MPFRLALNGVKIREVSSLSRVNDPVWSDDHRQVNGHEFAMQVPGVGNFYARDGCFVEYTASPGADTDWIKLYLNGQVLVALLHQRRIINFHASSFIHCGMGIMILGETGAGKSSLTASFALKGGGFLSDDLTPVIFRNSKPHIWPVTRAIKLSEHTVGQLNINAGLLTTAESGTGKQYLKVKSAGAEAFPLKRLLKIGTGDCLTPEFHEPLPAEKFTMLRSEICSWDILAGMPETEAEYLHQILEIVRQVKIVKVVRPVEIEVSALHEAVRDFLDGS